mmetsp:Transcript_65262/g.136699  ORF Transcript_65262/g.136699 Transcript_65262/m.136699 type:complete len:97 (+) Transcript_65262:11-301(+)
MIRTGTVRSLPDWLGNCLFDSSHEFWEKEVLAGPAGREASLPVVKEDHLLPCLHGGRWVGGQPSLPSSGSVEKQPGRRIEPEQDSLPSLVADSEPC